MKVEHVHISDVYKAVDADCAELKQQLKWEKERLKAYEKGKWGGDVIGAWGALISF